MKLVIMFFVSALFQVQLYAKYYISDWGVRPCCGNDSYFVWAEIWDDKGTNNLSDDRYVGTVNRVISGINISANGMITYKENFEEDKFDYPSDLKTEEQDLAISQKIMAFPNPLKSGEVIYLKNLPDGVNSFQVVITNLSNQQQSRFEMTGNSLKIPDWFPKGIYQIVFHTPDYKIYVEQRLIIE